MKRKWKLLQVSEVDPEGDRGKDPSYDVKKFKKSAGTNIKARALKELDNPETLLILGGGNQYVHSTEAYFRRGLKTAITRMNMHLEALVQEQQKVMRQLIIQINEEWRNKLDKAFGSDVFPTFAEFKKFWDSQIVHNPDPNDFMRRMQYLVELKNLKTKLGAFEYKKNQVLRSLEAGGRTNMDVFKMQQALLPFDVRVSVKERAGQNIFQYSGPEDGTDPANKQWQAAILEACKNITEQLFDPKKGIYQHVSPAVDKAIQSYKNGGSDKIEFDHANIGHLFEALSEGLYADIVKNPKTQEAMSLRIDRVAAEFLNNGKNNKTYKPDSKIALLVGNDVVLEFLASDKTGQSIDWQQAANDKRIDLNTRTVDQFTAVIESNTLDLSLITTNPLESFKSSQNEIMLLTKYVIANGFAFAGRVNITEFKELLVLYLAWMKVVVEIAGAENIQNTPIAIRTLKGIYNTADILELFVNLAPKEMHRYLNNHSFREFYKSDKKFSNRLKNMLFKSKKLALSNQWTDDEEYTGNMTYSELKSSSVSYPDENGVEFPSVSKMLQRINTSIKQNWPHIEGSFLIKLNNLHNKF